MESKCKLTDRQIEGTIAFHGHHCPGLTIGIRAAEWGLLEFGRAEDEEIIVVTETNMCAVDAIQFLIGCTFGKGNLIFRDIGKVAFTFFRRSDEKQKRIVLNPDFAQDIRAKQELLKPEQKNELFLLKQATIQRMMNADLNDLFLISVSNKKCPERVRIHKTIHCETCGEGVMEPRLQTVNGKKICFDCAKRLTSEIDKAY
ncbi:MAG: FmdE family protein [Planctomycetia bacterium]|nr:FmdE family protein [Planctomycetia bacterium]